MGRGSENGALARRCLEDLRDTWGMLLSMLSHLSLELPSEVS